MLDRTPVHTYQVAPTRVDVNLSVNKHNMKSQACVDCAKRKVRCDREEPCSNCKRRGKECLFPEISPSDRIKRLESLVRSLGGDPDSAISDEQMVQSTTVLPETTFNSELNNVQTDVQKVGRSSKSETQESPGSDSIIFQTGDETVYLESYTYHNWEGSKHEVDRSANRDQRAFRRAPEVSSLGSDALQSVISSFEGINLAEKLPNSSKADILWATFRHRVQPMIKILFDWEIDTLQTTAVRDIDELSIPQCALVHSIYLVSAASLSNEECLHSLGQSKQDVLSDMQTACEQALARSGFLWATDLAVIQALNIYATAGWTRLNVKSLWALVGVAIRSSERLGIHRDGTVLGLAPVETERRRRLWWSLQHLDIGLALQAGAVSLSLMSDWDVKLPLNIEDADFQPDAKTFPKERKGLTSISNCLFVYWHVHRQRRLRREDGTRYGLMWATDKTLSRERRELLLSEFEEAVNYHFLQYCEPIKPLDILLQLIARSYIYTTRRMVLQSIAQTNGTKYDGVIWEELLDACIQCIEYNMALHTNPMIQHLKWRLETYFQWSALVCIVLEAGQQRDKTRAGEIWELLSRLYSANHSLSCLQEDMRRFYAAELIVASWKAQEDHVGKKPLFVSRLESQLAVLSNYSTHEGSDRTKLKRKADWPALIRYKTPPRSESDNYASAASVQSASSSDHIVFSQSELDNISDLQFDDIDWGFWDSLS